MITSILNGVLGKDAEVKKTTNSNVINFSVAVTKGYGDKKKTLWVECSKFGDNTKIAEYLKKGTKVILTGEPDIRTYELSNGKSGSSFTLLVSTIELIGDKKEEQPAEIKTDEPISDLPF